MTDGPRIGLALSGGGFRATCFGLGCLRALHDRDLLRQVTVVSGISGGSILAGLYAYGPADFGEFDRLVVAQLRRGLQTEVLRRAFQPTSIARNLSRAARAALPHAVLDVRSANRTDALRDALADRVFGSRLVTEPTHAGLATVITATDLRTTNAVRFGSRVSACSAYGTIVEPMTVAEAIAASAAYPTLLPAIEREYTFTRQPGATTERHVLHLVDGGVYDNLGLSVLHPGRSRSHTPHTYDVDYVVLSDAGRGRPLLSRGHFLGTRLRRSFDITYRKAQDTARSRLHEAHAAGALCGFVQAYLGMPDERLPVPVRDLVPAAAVRGCPTSLQAMNEDVVQALSLRGEQLTRTLIAHYCPDL